MGRRLLRAGGPLVLSVCGVLAFIAFAARAGNVPFFALRALDVGVPLEPFGTIVVIGVVIGAQVLHRYAARHGIADTRDLTLWVVLTGGVGAHVVEILAYERQRLDADPWLLLKLWDGISSYGGFLGGAIGYVLYVRWKRLPAGMIADATMLGLLVAFTIGRIACSVTHDHIGRATTFWMGTDYPRAELARRSLLSQFPGAGDGVRAHNLGLYELLYLVPLNALALSVAFDAELRLPAGLIAASIALLYAPMRFFLEYLRLDVSDPRYAGLTFAQWCSVGTFALALGVAVKLWRSEGPGSRPTPNGSQARTPGRPRRARASRARASRRRAGR
jgi:phosphatidylglycerol:prolipoprotein diacylglycerol transferase